MDNQHNTTRRRVIIGAVAAIPAAAIALPAIAQTQPDTTEWDRAYSIWLPIKQHHHALCERWERLEESGTSRAEEDAAYAAIIANGPAYREARDRFMAVPAPHCRALLAKIEISTLSLDDDHAEAVLADARRLLSGEA